MMKAAVTDYIEEDLNWEKEQLAAAGIELSVHQLKFRPEEEVIGKIGDADAVVVNMVKMTESLLSRLPKCKLLIRHGIGYDNVDVEACTRLGIQFAYQPDYCVEDVAEHAIALLFSCVRKIGLSRRTLDHSSARGEWDFSGIFPIYRMRGKTLGIIGLGRIGIRVFEKLKNFGFRFLGCDPYMDAERATQLGIEMVPLEKLLRESDFITLHTPLTPDTRHLINAETLRLMKPTAIVINTSRGPMVDAEALAAALRENRIGGAGIDVYDVEPPPTSLPLFGLDNAVLTPHLGWASVEAGWEIRKSIVNDILAFAAGKPARYVVNKEVLKGQT